MNVKMTLPLSVAQESLMGDLERELRLQTAIAGPFPIGQFDDMDSRRVRKIQRREQDACKIRIAGIQNALVYEEQRKS
jgi:hypothetical protein